MAAAAIPTAVGPPESEGKSRNSRETREKRLYSRETWCMGPYAGMDYNLTLCRTNTCIMGDPMPEWTLPLCQSQLYPQSGTKNLISATCSRATGCQMPETVDTEADNSSHEFL
jgi:hypothetical protein